MIDNLDLGLLAAELIRDEGRECLVYDDATGERILPGTRVHGHPTIGVGRALDTKGISRDEAIYLLGNDISEYVGELGALPWFAAMDATRQRALLNMRHQLGLGGLLGFHDMIAALTIKDWEAAARAAEASSWFVQTPLRAGRVLLLLREGDGVVS